jgi:hypothetical protein
MRRGSSSGTRDDFTVDFAALQFPPDDESPQPARVVSRVRLPAAAMFELMTAINERMSAYEAEWGEIVAPRRRTRREDE